MSRQSFVVAIDGPAASGKSALGSRLARRLGFAYLDTGLIYRALTALALSSGVATPEVRAQRRWAELAARGVATSFPDILEDLIRRDARDSNRAISPLRAASDAVIIHTDHLTLAGEVELAGRLVAAARGAAHRL